MLSGPLALKASERSPIAPWTAIPAALRAGRSRPLLRMPVVRRSLRFGRWGIREAGKGVRSRIVQRTSKGWRRLMRAVFDSGAVEGWVKEGRVSWKVVIENLVGESLEKGLAERFW